MLWRKLRTTDERLLSLDDLRGEANLAIASAVHGFDESKGVPFTAWATQLVRWALIDYVRVCLGRTGARRHAASWFYVDDADFEAVRGASDHDHFIAAGDGAMWAIQAEDMSFNWSDFDAMLDVWNELARMPRRKATILLLRASGFSDAAIGQALGVSYFRIYQIVNGKVSGQNASPAEKRMVILAAQGLSMSETAAKLGLSIETVKTHRKNAMKKLGAKNIAHAVALAYQRGWIHEEESDV